MVFFLLHRNEKRRCPYCLKLRIQHQKKKKRIDSGVLFRQSQPIAKFRETVVKKFVKIFCTFASSETEFRKPVPTEVKYHHRIDSKSRQLFAKIAEKNILFPINSGVSVILKTKLNKDEKDRNCFFN